MLLITRLCLLWLSLFSIGTATLLFCITDSQPTVKLQQSFSWANIIRARQIIHGYRIRPVDAGENTTVRLSERDLTLASNYLLKQVASGRTETTLENSTATVLASIQLPKNPFAPYLNAKLIIKQDQQQQPVIDALAIGRLNIAPELAVWLIDNLILNPSIDDHEQLLTIQSIRRFNITPKYLSFLHPDFGELFPAIQNIQPVDEQRFKDYQLKLAELLDQPKTKKRPPLDQLLRPMFQFAKERSRHSDPIKENQALLLALNQAFNGDSINSLLPPLSASHSKPQVAARLKGRGDLSQHFVGSAALTASTNAQVSNTIGVYKEFKDSYVGSGFSFIDLASDMAGTRFGEMAVASPEMAHHLQRIMSQNQLDSVYMPNIDGLPEHLSTLEFNLRYAMVNNRRFKRLVKRVERRIDNCPLYQRGALEKGQLQTTTAPIKGKELT